MVKALLDHIERDLTGWRAVLQEHTGPVAEIGAAVEEHSRRLTLKLLDVQMASPLLQAAPDGWAALERWCRCTDLLTPLADDLGDAARPTAAMRLR